MIDHGRLALKIHRYGCWVDSIKSPAFRWPLNKLYWIGFSFSEICSGISIPKSVRIGPGLKIWHFGSIIIHPSTVIGANCILRQGVTLGNRRGADDAPVIGDDVEFGAYSQVLGNVRVGHKCRVGAMTVVLKDVPDGATVVGNPGRIILYNNNKFNDPIEK